MDRTTAATHDRTRHVDRPSHSQELRRPTRGQAAAARETSLFGPRYR